MRCSGKKKSLREKCPNTDVFLVRIFLYSDWINLRKSPYLVRIQENTDQKKLRIWTLFTQWMLLRVFQKCGKLSEFKIIFNKTAGSKTVKLQALTLRLFLWWAIYFNIGVFLEFSLNFDCIVIKRHRKKSDMTLFLFLF